MEVGETGTSVAGRSQPIDGGPRAHIPPERPDIPLLLHCQGRRSQSFEWEAETAIALFDVMSLAGPERRKYAANEFLDDVVDVSLDPHSTVPDESQLPGTATGLPNDRRGAGMGSKDP